MTKQEIKDCVLKKITKYEQAIMIFTLGNSKDEFGEEYTNVYKYEWNDAKINISNVLSSLLINNIYETDIVAGIILAEWDGVMTYNKRDLCLDGLRATCSNILEEVNKNGYK